MERERFELQLSQPLRAGVVIGSGKSISSNVPRAQWHVVARLKQVALCASDALDSDDVRRSARSCPHLHHRLRDQR